MNRIEEFKNLINKLDDNLVTFKKNTIEDEYSCFNRLPFSLDFYNCGQAFFQGKNGALTYSSHIKTYYTKECVAMCLVANEGLDLLTSIHRMSRNNNIFQQGADFDYILSELVDKIYSIKDFEFKKIPFNDDEKYSGHHEYYSKELDTYGNFNFQYGLNFIYSSKIFHAILMLIQEERDFLTQMRNITSENQTQSNRYIHGFFILNDLVKFIEAYNFIYKKL